MSRWQGPAWAALGAAVMALGIYGSGSFRRDAGEAGGGAEAANSDVENKDLLADPATLVRMGVKTAAVTVVSQAATADGFARGLDAGPLAAIVAEVDAAQAAADASRAEATRLETLYRQDVSASRRSVEAAHAQALSDASRARLAQQRIGLEFGPGLMRLGPAGVRQLLGDIVYGRAGLIRIDIPGVALPPGTVVQIGERETPTSVRVLGPAAAADAKLQSAGVIAIVHGPLTRQSLAGRILPARVASGPSTSGVLVPRDAIVRFQGHMYVYRWGGKRFVRVALPDPQPMGDGWFVQGGLRPGDSVAIAGAAGLLAIDAGSAVSDAEE